MLTSFEGAVYRGLTLQYQLHPLSGEGARIHGGRFNPKGVAALYTALDIGTVAKELQGKSKNVPPHMLVELRISSERVLDLRAVAALDILGLTRGDLGLPFRDYDYSEVDLANYLDTRLQLPPSQMVAIGALALGADAVLVPAQHANASEDEVNLVLFEWNVTDATSAKLVDPDERLPNAKTEAGRSDRKLCRRVFEIRHRS